MRKAVVLLCLVSLSDTSGGATEEMTVSSAASRRRAVAPGAPATPSSSQLIRAAREAGQIDDETALLYEVFAAHEDDRLPQQFRGDDSTIFESTVLAEVVARIAILRPEIQDLLAPFLLPPIYRTTGARAASKPPVCSAPDPDWDYLDTSNGHMRIWWLKSAPTHRAHAAEMAGWIDTDIWPKMVQIFNGRLPLSDLGESCNGGDGRLDIYLTRVGKAVVTPYGDCSPSPAFVTAGAANGLIGQQVLTHEIAHLFQYAYKLHNGGCLFNEAWVWLADSTAHWTIDQVYKTRNGEHGAAPQYLDRPHLSLDHVDQKHEYGAYLWPFFLSRKFGAGVVTQIWENTAGANAVDAIEAAIAKDGGFEKLWPEFVLHNWNRPPIEKYHDDELTAGARPFEERTVVPDAHILLAADLPRLSSRYFHYKFPANARSVAFFNGLNFALEKRRKSLGALDIGLQYELNDASPATTRGASVQAIIKQNDRWLDPEDWSQARLKQFCLQRQEERIEELVLIVSNSDHAAGRTLAPAALPPTLVVSDVGCSWMGKLQFEAGSVTSTAFGPIKMTFDLDRREFAASLPFPGFAYTTGGTASWTVNGPGGPCTYSGSGSVPLENLVQVTFNFAPPESATYRRAYLPQHGGNLEYLRMCPGVPPMSVTYPAPPFPPSDTMPSALVTLPVDGGWIRDAHTNIVGDRWTWEFRATR